MNTLVKKYIKGDVVIWIVFVMLCLISVVELYSSGSIFVKNKANHASELIRHASFLIAGGVLAWAVHRMPFRFVRNLGYFLFPISIILLALLLIIPTPSQSGETSLLSIGNISLFGLVVENHAARWVTFFGFIRFQPSELAKIALVICMSDLLTALPEKSRSLFMIAKLRKRELTEDYANSLKFWIAFGMLIFFCALIYSQNLSTAILVFTVGVIIIFISNVSFKRLTGVLIALAAIGALFIFIQQKYIDSNDAQSSGRASTWINRIDEFMSEDEASKYDYNAKSAQVIHSQIAIARGGTFGVFPGNSVERDYLPQAFADFIFAIVVEEMGLIGGVALIFFYMVLLYRAGILAKASPNLFSALLVIGLTTMIVFQALISMGVAVRLGPVTGQPLPLISRGGTSIMITCIYIGIIQCVARNINEMNKRAELEKQKAAEAELELLEDKNWDEISETSI